MESDPLFTELTLKDHTLDNRVGLAPMTRTSATDDGQATDQMAQYYASFARGGFSFLVTEGIHPDTTHSQGYAINLVLPPMSRQQRGSQSSKPSTQREVQSLHS